MYAWLYLNERHGVSCGVFQSAIKKTEECVVNECVTDEVSHLFSKILYMCVMI